MSTETITTEAGNPGAVPAAPAGDPPAKRTTYGTLWAGVPREVAYLIGAFPIAIISFSITIALFSAGAGTLVTFFIGVILWIVMLYVARGFGTLDLAFVEWASDKRIPRPNFEDARARTGFFGWVRAVLGNGHYWLYVLHSAIVDFPLKTITFSLIVTWLATGLGGITYWFWGRFIPQGDRGWNLSTWISDVFGLPQPGNALVADALWYLVFGVVFLATLPLVSRGFTLIHWWVARGLLGGWKSDELQREVQRLEVSRAAATSAEGQSLRRLERDIHDGPQQRLVRLQMDLAAAERQMDSDPKAAQALINEAMTQSKEALDELRALSRGFAPPILLDRGLVAALESAAVRSTVTAKVVNELPKGFELPQEIERNAYFVASEALANAAKHAGANTIEVRVATRRVLDDDATWLDVTVTDDGRGGATSVPGHGIAGLDDRVRGLGGTLEVDSPSGGPTMVRAHFPLTTSVQSAV
jgi:signal transduction histidine kinase